MPGTRSQNNAGVSTDPNFALAKGSNVRMEWPKGTKLSQVLEAGKEALARSGEDAVELEKQVESLEED
ncbi:unnamed protein product [Tilletia controversa]|nr:unnamed protein product [Tilletia controversa]CAD6925952.1 unnamed protein product [Tilletia controversa]CAD6929753.1 unnamed protein product [Tilletia controversa]